VKRAHIRYKGGAVALIEQMLERVKAECPAMAELLRAAGVEAR